MAIVEADLGLEPGVDDGDLVGDDGPGGSRSRCSGSGGYRPLLVPDSPLSSEVAR